MRFFHTTDVAPVILREGFRDGHGSYGLVNLTLPGVFLAKYPADCNDGAHGDQVLEVVLPGHVDMTEYAINEEGHELWEWCVPASLINQHGSVRLLTDEEEEHVSRSQWTIGEPVILENLTTAELAELASGAVILDDHGTPWFRDLLSVNSSRLIWWQAGDDSPHDAPEHGPFRLIDVPAPSKRSLRG